MSHDHHNWWQGFSNTASAPSQPRLSRRAPMRIIGWGKVVLMEGNEWIRAGATGYIEVLWRLYLNEWETWRLPPKQSAPRSLGDRIRGREVLVALVVSGPPILTCFSQLHVNWCRGIYDIIRKFDIAYDVKYAPTSEKFIHVCWILCTLGHGYDMKMCGIKTNKNGRIFVFMQKRRYGMKQRNKCIPILLKLFCPCYKRCMGSWQNLERSPSGGCRQSR